MNDVCRGCEIKTRAGSFERKDEDLRGTHLLEPLHHLLPLLQRRAAIIEHRGDILFFKHFCQKVAHLFKLGEDQDLFSVVDNGADEVDEQHGLRKVRHQLVSF